MKIIFDTDPGVDDALAFLVLHHHPDTELLGITTVFGNASIENTTRNARYLRALVGSEAPIAQGAGGPLVGQARTPPAHIHGHNGLGDISLPAEPEGSLDGRPAHRFLIDTVRQHPGEVTIVAVGPLTNLGLALREDPDFAGLVREVVIMGGAFGTGDTIGQGNATPAAEANIHNDALAADMVFTAPWKVVALGLDVTRRTVQGAADLDRLRDKGGRLGRFVWDVSRVYLDFHRGFGVDGLQVHDSCAVVYALAPQLFTLRHGPVRVATAGATIGQTVQKPDGFHCGPGDWDDAPSQAAATGVDAEGVLAFCERTVFGKLG